MPVRVAGHATIVHIGGRPASPREILSQIRQDQRSMARRAPRPQIARRVFRRPIRHRRQAGRRLSSACRAGPKSSSDGDGGGGGRRLIVRGIGGTDG